MPNFYFNSPFSISLAMNLFRYSLIVGLGYLLLLINARPALAQSVPRLIHWQGKVTSVGVNFDGIGQFKFALVNGSGTTTYWSHDGSSLAGAAPAQTLSIPVRQGVYAVALGENMQPVTPSVFAHSDVRLRVWFNDGVRGFQLLTPDQRITSVGYAMMADQVPDGSITTAKLAAGAVTSASLAPQAVGPTQLAPGAVLEGLGMNGGVIVTRTPSPALLAAGYELLSSRPGDQEYTFISDHAGTGAIDHHSAVWTGTEMIVSQGTRFSTYLPAEDRWKPMVRISIGRSADYSYGLDTVRKENTTVWTGTEMILWGGSNMAVPALGNPVTRTLFGGHMDRPLGLAFTPATKTTRVLPEAGAPSPRTLHAAVWTGTEMIIWGGTDGIVQFNDGARYNPTTLTWSPMTMTGAPSPRHWTSAVWTGSEMIIWGGWHGTASPTDGGRYNPATNTWSPISLTGAPRAVASPSLVWTGTHVIAWGGNDALGVYNTGGRYHPATNTWSPLSLSGAPAGRTLHSTVWTGTEMIIFGGWDGALSLDTGARYRPTTDTWTPLSSTGAPIPRQLHRAVWTGSDMIISCGRQEREHVQVSSQLEPIPSLASCGRYSPTTDQWSPVWLDPNMTPPPNPTVAVQYPKTPETPAPIDNIVHNWPKQPGLFDTLTKRFGEVSLSGAPSARRGHTFTSIGTDFLVWGGRYDETFFSDGKIYSPLTRRWRAISPPPVGFASRFKHEALWTGTHVIIYGGWISSTPPGIALTNTGAFYRPATDTWTLMSTVGAPYANRGIYFTIGQELFVDGGFGQDNTSFNPNLYVYDLSSHSWSDLGRSTGDFNDMIEFYQSSAGFVIDDTYFNLARLKKFDPSTRLWTRFAPAFYVGGNSGGTVFRRSESPLAFNGADEGGGGYIPATDLVTRYRARSGPAFPINFAILWVGQAGDIRVVNDRGIWSWRPTKREIYTYGKIQ
jgi:Kelch motif